MSWTQPEPRAGNARTQPEPRPGRAAERLAGARVVAAVRPPASGAQKRDAIFQRDGHRCVYCGLQFDASELTLDHVEPRMRGGDQSGGNLVTCCESCNREKGGQPAWSFLATRPAQRENFLRYATATWPRLRRAVEQAARVNNPTRRPKL